MENLSEELIEGCGVKLRHYNNFIKRYFDQFIVNKGLPNEQYVNLHTNG